MCVLVADNLPQVLHRRVHHFDCFARRGGGACHARFRRAERVLGLVRADEVKRNRRAGVFRVNPVGRGDDAHLVADAERFRIHIQQVQIHRADGDGDCLFQALLQVLLRHFQQLRRVLRVELRHAPDAPVEGNPGFVLDVVLAVIDALDGDLAVALPGVWNQARHDLRRGDVLGQVQQILPKADDLPARCAALLRPIQIACFAVVADAQEAAVDVNQVVADFVPGVAVARVFHAGQRLNVHVADLELLRLADRLVVPRQVQAEQPCRRAVVIRQFVRMQDAIHQVG